jgi:hypothetical protein
LTSQPSTAILGEWRSARFWEIHHQPTESSPHRSAIERTPMNPFPVFYSTSRREIAMQPATAAAVA